MAYRSSRRHGGCSSRALGISIVSKLLPSSHSLIGDWAVSQWRASTCAMRSRLPRAWTISCRTSTFFRPWPSSWPSGGQVGRAVELYALAAREPFVANSRWSEEVAGREISGLAATLPAHVVAAAEARGRDRDVKATIAELVAEL